MRYLPSRVSLKSVTSLFAALTLVACGALEEHDRLQSRSIVVNQERNSGDLQQDSGGDDHENPGSDHHQHQDDCHAHLALQDCNDGTGDEEEHVPGSDSDDTAGDGSQQEEQEEQESMPAIVEFRIATGTGSGAWNTVDSQMTLRVGQTLRFINEDTVNHRLHTNGNRPCPHGPNIAPGASWDCVLGQTYSRAQNGELYNHNVGRSAPFFFSCCDRRRLKSSQVEGYLEKFCLT